MRNNENQEEISTNQAVDALEQLNKLYLILDFFIQYPADKIKANTKALKFWKKVLFNDPNLMGDPNHRLEFLAIIDQQETLLKLVEKITPYEMMKLDAALRSDNVELRKNIVSKFLA